jgi:hypothetical protein
MLLTSYLMSKPRLNGFSKVCRWRRCRGMILVDFCASCDPYFILENFSCFYFLKKKKKKKKSFFLIIYF